MNARAIWRKRARLDMQFAEKVLLTDGMVRPIFVIHTEHGHHLITSQWQNDEEKDQTREFVRLCCVAYDATALTFITEAWLRRVPRYPRETAAEHRARFDAIAPRDAEDRIEAVMVCIAFRDAAGERHTVFHAREIARGSDGEPSGLEAELTDKEFDLLGGLMADILPETAPTAREQIAAQRVLDRATAGSSRHS